MISEKNCSGDSSTLDSARLAIAVLAERVRSLPQADRDDLFELSKLLYLANEEEANSAANAMIEILDQKKNGTATRVQPAEEVGEELDKWVSFISDRIRSLRKAAGITQEQLASASGIPQSHISRLENGQHSPSFLTLEKIASALGVNVSELDPSA